MHKMPCMTAYETIRGHDQNSTLKRGLSYCHAYEKQECKSFKISESKFRELLRLFSINLEATQIAELTGLNRNTVNRFLKAIRVRLAEFCE